MTSENKTLTPVWIAYVDGKRLDTGYEPPVRKFTFGLLQRRHIHNRKRGLYTSWLQDLRSPYGGKNAFIAPQAKQGNKMRIV